MSATEKFGVSFSIKQCRDFKIDPKSTLSWLQKEAGFKRFRLNLLVEVEDKLFHHKDL